VSRLGADPAALERTARLLRSTADRLDGLDARLTSTVRTAGWHGPDAEEFSRRWRHDHRPAIARAAEACRRSARGLDGHASEQTRAAAVDSGAVAAASTGPGAAATGRTPTGAPPGPALTATPSRPVRSHPGLSRPDLPHPELPPLPERVDTFSARVDATLGPGAAGSAGNMVVEHLGGGRVRVSQRLDTALGGSVGAGAAAAVVVGGRTRAGSGIAASGSARVGSATTRSWELDQERVPLLVAALAAEASPLGTAHRLTDRVAGTIDDLASVVGVDLSLSGDPAFPLLPTPSRVEHLTTVALGGTATAGGALSATTSSTVAVGTADGDEGRRWVAEWHVATSADGAELLLSGLGLDDVVPPGADVAVRLDLPAPDTSAARTGDGVLTVTSTLDGVQATVRVAVPAEHLDDVRHHIGAAARALAQGDGEAAGRSLLSVAFHPPPLGVEVTRGRLEQRGGSLPMAAVALSVDPGGTWTTVERRG
jgi:hypothetical protein